MHQDVYEARDAAACAMQGAQGRGREQRAPVEAGHSQAVGHVGADFALLQPLHVLLEGDALQKLAD